MKTFTGQRAVVIGAGVSGRAAARVLVEEGAEVRISESGASPMDAAMDDLGVEVASGGHRPEHLDGATILVTSPGVPEGAEVLEWATERGLAIWSELELGARLCAVPYVGITGTNGKTTTTEIVAASLRADGLDAIACGNIGHPFSLAAREDHDALAVEASSFQLRFASSFHPRVSVLLNIAEDHLDWHGSMRSYVDAKARIFALQGDDDVHVGNADDPVAAPVSQRAPCPVVWFRLGEPSEGEVGFAHGDVVSRMGPGPAIRLGRPGSVSEGFRADAAAAAAAALAYGVSADAVRSGIASVGPLPHRGATVAVVAGVRFVDDSKATNPHAALAALAGIDDVVLIAGGRSKGVNLAPLADAAARLAGVVAIGEATDEIVRVFDGKVRTVRRADTIEDAVATAASMAPTDGIVLLAPACASQDMFTDYRERGDRFAAAARALEKGSTLASRVETVLTRRLRLVTPIPVKRERARSAAAAAAIAATRRDTVLLLVPTAILVAVGLIMVLSASSITAAQEYGSSFHYFFKQGVFAALGVVALAVCSRLTVGVWRALALPLVLLSGALLLLVLHPAFGITGGGSARWLQFGPVTVQPSEIAKLGMIAFAAMVLERKQRHLDEPLHLAVPLVPVLGVIAALVMLQPDLGTTMLITGSVFVVVFLAGVRLRILAAVAVVGGLLGYVLVMGESYRRARLLGFLDPLGDPQNTGYHLKQSLIALGSGGWTGVGLGAGQQKWGWLPNAETDFIFSVIGEELGLLVAFVVLALFGALFVAGIRIAMRSPDRFGRMLAGGITGWLGLQTIVNLGAVTGLLPITGVPLPLLSYGGSNLLVTLAAIGILWSVARASAAAAASGSTPAAHRIAASGRSPARRPRSTGSVGR